MADELFVYEVIFIAQGKLKSSRLISTSEEKVLGILKVFYGSIQVIKTNHLGAADTYKP